jgi:PAS domain S-box-containing protein
MFYPMEEEPSTVRVLHVDDDHRLVEMAAEFVEREGRDISVETATGAEEGLTRLADTAFDCVVSDYQMPGTDGIEFLETVRDEKPGLPFILFTANGSETVASDAISAGVTDYLHKGDGVEQYELLARRIENAVSKRRAERRAARTERRLRELSEATNDVLFTTTADMDEVLFVNSAYEDIWGRSRESLFEDPMDFLEGVHPVDRDAVERATERLRSGESVDIEYRVNEAEGFDRWVWVQADPIRDDSGEVIRLAGWGRDITERKHQAERFREFIEHSGDIVSVLDPDGTYQYQSTSSERILGYDPEELIGENVFEYVHPEDRERVVRSFDRAVSDSEITPTVEYRFQHADGSWRWFESIGNNQFDNPAIEGFVVNSRDITERKEYERKLSRLHDVADEFSDCESVEQVCERTIEASRQILEFDLSVIAVENDGMLSPVAVSEDIPGDGMTDMSVEDGIAGRTYRSGESFLVNDVDDHEGADPQGPYGSGISVALGDHGNFQAVAESVDAFDQTDLELAELLANHAESRLDRIEYERRLEDRNERLDQFASIVAHDLRNPLGVVAAETELAREQGSAPDLDRIDSAVGRARRIIEDVLTMARNEGDVENARPVSIATLAREVWEVGETEGGTLHVEEDRLVMADRSRLRELVGNLFTNALQHGGDGVEVHLGSIGDDGTDRAGFYVADDGPGIDPENREAVFEAGYTTDDGGIGLGLQIVSQIATDHGWTVDVVESESGGARFEFTDVSTAAVSEHD